MLAAHLPVDALADRCREETEKFGRRQVYDPQYCFELLRRALAEGLADAFTRVYQVYEKQVLGWVYSHSRFEQTGESADYFAGEAWRTFYFALRGPKFERFPALPQALAYLKLCVHTAIAQYLRDQPRTPSTPIDNAGEVGEEHDLASAATAAELWARIRQLLPDERDQLLARCAFLLHLKPREIVELHRTHWRDEREVSVALYRIRRLLRSDPELLELAGITPAGEQIERGR